jgi:hypothetical protein
MDCRHQELLILFWKAVPSGTALRSHTALPRYCSTCRHNGTSLWRLRHTTGKCECWASWGNVHDSVFTTSDFPVILDGQFTSQFYYESGSRCHCHFTLQFPCRHGTGFAWQGDSPYHLWHRKCHYHIPSSQSSDCYLSQFSPLHTFL